MPTEFERILRISVIQACIWDSNADITSKVRKLGLWYLRRCSDPLRRDRDDGAGTTQVTEGARWTPSGSRGECGLPGRGRKDGSHTTPTNSSPIAWPLAAA